MFRGDALGVELYAVDGVLAVREAHDQTVVGLGSDLQRVREGVAVDQERMVAGRLEPVRQAGEQAAVGMVDAAELAVHRPRRAHDLAAERLPDRLMTETDAEDRDRKSTRLNSSH